jgi:hypothetical protein
MDGLSSLGLEPLILHGRKLRAKVAEAVRTSTLDLTMEGASTLSLGLIDQDRELIRSDLFNSRVALALDELVFEFVGYDKSGHDLTVEFESAGAADLRDEKGSKIVADKTTTRTEFAERLVSDVKWLEFKGDPGDRNKTVMTRGKTENSWDALQRLGPEERQWRCFEHRGTIYFGSDEWLEGLTDPIVVSEDLDWIRSIDPSYDGGRRATECTISCYAKRWFARPGAPVNVNGLGDLASKAPWLVYSISRDLNSPLATVTLTRKVPELPEPKPEPVSHDDSGAGAASGTSGTPGPTSAQGFQWPLRGVITGRFGDDRGDHAHQGLDIAAATGSPIKAAKPGRVIVAGYLSGYGNAVYIDHGDGSQTRYAHLNSIGARVGQSVGYSSIIGTCGSTGDSTGPHLHFEVLIGGVARDPLGYLP